MEIVGNHTTATIHSSAMVEEECFKNLEIICDHPAFTNPIVIMPDAHAGVGSVIGFTMKITDKTVPNTIGLDVGCGILAVNMGRDFSINHDEADKAIRQAVPFNFNIHDKPIIDVARYFDWKTANETLRKFTYNYNSLTGQKYSQVLYNYQWFISKCAQIGIDVKRAENSIGTLGGGNHFIEIGKVANTREYWILIHSGSRNFGKRVCEYWQKKAKKSINEVLIKQYHEIFKNIKKYVDDKTQLVNIRKGLKEALRLDDVAQIPKGLEWLEGKDAYDYLTDMVFAQHYADINRMYIFELIKRAIGVEGYRHMIKSVHNYVDFEDLFIRKGAIRSYKGEAMVIPLNMRDGTLICMGKSNEGWNKSAPHGAGRTMSRTKAKESLSVKDFKFAMENVYSTSVNEDTLDEAPNAYKNSEEIAKAIEPTANVLNKIIPIHNLK